MAEARTKPVSVRLPPEVHELLDEQSKEKGSERSDYLRELIVRGLSAGDGADEVAERLAALDRRVQDVRQDLATMMKTVLVMLANVDPEAADDWVRENFRSTNGGGE